MRPERTTRLPSILRYAGLTLALVAMMAGASFPSLSQDRPAGDKSAGDKPAGARVPGSHAGANAGGGGGAGGAHDPASLANDAWGQAVRLGQDLMLRTYALIGPEVADPTNIYAGNNLACTNCHLDAGASSHGLPLVGVYAAYPSFNPRSDRVISLEERINQCMTRSMNGRPLPSDGTRMVAILSWLKFLSDGVPVGHPPASPAAAPQPPSVPDAANGAGVFARTCAACHGANGEGQRVGKVGDAKGYQFPPLWGPDSFNRQAGMDRIMIAARFIHNNMPAGSTPQQPGLSVQEAWDVAAFVDARDRP